MEITKKIKSSKRGVTFSFDGFGKFMPGKRYRYILDKGKKMLMIFPVEEETNSLKISRKVTGGKEKALFDLRSKEVVSTMNLADFIEIEIHEEKIIVTTAKKVKQAEKEKIVSINQCMDVLSSFSIQKECLKAAGSESSGFYQYSLEDVFGDFIYPSAAISHQVQKELPDVIRVISVFSGAGMLDLPFKLDKDFSIVYACEHDPDACNTYIHNIGNHMHQVDVRTIKGKDIPAADLMIGGCPCQPYSRANPSSVKRGQNHEEGDLLKEYVRLVKETGIKLFFIENVPQFLTDMYGENMAYIQTELGKDYEISTKVVCDSDVGGFTKRKRSFILGAKRGILGRIEIPDVKVRPAKTVGQALEKVHQGWKNFWDITKPSPETKYRISLIPEGGNWKDLPPQLQTKGVHSNMYRRLDRNAPSVTICNWRKYLLSPPRYDDSGAWDRILSVAEAAALSGLTESFTFYGKLSSMQQQVGNGVPFFLAKFAKNIIKKAFECSKEKQTCMMQV